MRDFEWRKWKREDGNNLVRVLLNVGPSFQWFSVDLDICRVKGLELRKVELFVILSIGMISMFLKRIILTMYYNEGENDLIIGIGISSEFSIKFSITNLVIGFCCDFYASI